MKKFILIVLIIVTHSTWAGRFEIPLDKKIIDGIELGVTPGDTILLLPGSRGEVSFENLTGSLTKPIVIINKKGKVIIHSTISYAISFTNSVHFKLTGTGGKDKYGIEIATSGIQGVSISEFSSYAEVDHLEIHNVGFAGIVAKTDPNCTRKDLRYFIMNNLSFHDNYIYETKGEGFYVGYSWHPTRSYTCGNDSLLYSHEIHGVRIYNNIIRDTHWDGLQVGSSTRDVKVYGNSIYNYGIDKEKWQNHGVQIGAGTTGELFNNVIHKGTGGGVSFFGGGNNRLFNNLILYTGDQAIYQNDKGAKPGTTYEIVNNTIVFPAEAGVWVNTLHTKNNVVANNIIVIANTNEAVRNANDRWKAESNLAFSTLSEAGFIFPDAMNFRLKKDSRAIDGGAMIDWLTFDHQFTNRPSGKLMDVGAFEYSAKKKGTINFPFEGSIPHTMVVETKPIHKIYTPKLSSLKGKDNLSYVLYDGAGLIVRNGAIGHEPTSLTVSTEGLTKGVYYLSIRSLVDPVELRRIVID